MRKNHVKLLTLTTALCFTASFLSGCVYEDKIKNADSTASYVGELSNDFWEQIPVATVIPVESSPKPILTIKDYEASLLECTTLESIPDVLSNPENYDEKTCEICACKNLLNHGYHIEDVEDQLNNIMVFSQVPTDVPLDVWEMIVGKLSSTLSEFCNPFSAYYALAKNIHLLSCNLEHSEEYGIFTCDSLKEQSEKVRPIPIEEYFDGIIKDNYAYSKIKTALSENEYLSFNDFIIELENLLLFQKDYANFPDNETWNTMFAHLNNTLAEQESLYDVYFELAIYVHNTLYPEEEYTVVSDTASRKIILN